jgi:hypothetical protein
MKRKHKLTLIVFLFLFAGVCFGCWALARSFSTSPLRRKLPPTAQQVQEWRWSEEGPLGQDYSYALKARITEEEFLAYVHELDMAPYSVEKGYGYGFVLTWRPPGMPPELEWWDPSDSYETTYIYDGRSWWTYAKWENGFIYVVSYNI